MINPPNGGFSNGVDSMPGFKVTVNLSEAEKALMRDFGPGGDVQREWSRLVFDGSIPYLPFRTGTFRNLAQAASIPVFAYGELIYPGPYARYLYNGEVYGYPETGKAAMFSEDYGFWSKPGVKKSPLGRDLQYDQSANPKAGPRWVERAANDNKETWINDLQRYVDTGGK
jgi:hypothetical protein